MVEKFEEKTKDPERLKVRGYNLLNEEKQRKQFTSQLPKLELDLASLADEYRKANGGREFTIKGLEYSEFIQVRRKLYTFVFLLPRFQQLSCFVCVCKNAKFKRLLLIFDV